MITAVAKYKLGFLFMIWIKKIKNINLFYDNLERYARQGPFRLNIFNPWQDFYELTKGVYYSKGLKNNVLKLYNESGRETRGGVPLSLKSYFVSKIFVKGEKGWLLGCWFPCPIYLLLSFIFLCFDFFSFLFLPILIFGFSIFSYIEVRKTLKKIFK